jgi:CheY-like chemotaxis protein
MAKLILIVDDNADIRSSLGEMLTEDGFTTALMPDGRAALDALQGGLRPDLILLDLMMPRMDGAQFRLEQLKDPAISAIPVVLMTAVRDFDERSLQVKTVLRKPFSLEDITNAIVATLQAS